MVGQHGTIINSTMPQKPLRCNWKPLSNHANGFKSRRSSEVFEMLEIFEMLRIKSLDAQSGGWQTCTKGGPKSEPVNTIKDS